MIIYFIQLHFENKTKLSSYKLPKIRNKKFKITPKSGPSGTNFKDYFHVSEFTSQNRKL